METASKNKIWNNYLRVLERIDRAARTTGRDPGEIKIVVVTKGHPIEAVNQAISAGLHVFGENYAEEGIRKMTAIRQPVLSGKDILEWHMIGHIQSRKAHLVCEHYHYVHSLDSIKLANRLDRFTSQEFAASTEEDDLAQSRTANKLPVLLECNMSGEETKFGWPAWEEAKWERLLQDYRQILSIPNLEVRGLMTMAPFSSDPEQARPFFQRLRKLQEYLKLHLPESDWRELSMGMSDDFETAVQEGATLVRIGTAIMGPRPQD